VKALTSVQLAKHIVELLKLQEGESIDLSKLRDGSVLLRKVESL